MPEKRNNRLLKWLLIVNLMVLAVLGTRHFYIALKTRAENHRKAVVAATTLVELNLFDLETATKLMGISQNAEADETLADSDVDLCLQLLKDTTGPSPGTPAFRRNMISNVLRYAIMHNALTPTQREKIVQAMIARLPLDDPHNESGTDVTDVALTMAALKDTRALSLLRPYMDDQRRAVRRTVRSAVATLEGRSAK